VLLIALGAGAHAGCYVGPSYGTAELSTPAITQAPPSPRAERLPPAPMPSAIWVPGYWAWAQPTGWAWVPGRYDMRPGHVWVAPRYVRLPSGGWAFIRGHWRRRR
jgi:hypothetical protein